MKNEIKVPESMFNDHIREDGTIDDTIVETYFYPLETLIPEHEKRYIRLLCDAGGFDAETRLAYATLEAMGWTAPTKKKAEAMGD